MFTIGDFEAHLINDVTTQVDGGGAFGLVPRKLWSRYFAYDEDNLVPMAQNCLFVRANGKNILVDTGLGTRLEDKQRRFWKVSGEGGLLRGLATLGVAPHDIDLVINTHLHSDHCSGNISFVDDNKQDVRPTFPNAEYVVQRGEYEMAMQPNERTVATYLPVNYEPLVKSGQMRLLDGDTEILASVWGIVTRGHTPHHMSVRLESQNQHAMFVCDTASYAVHFEKLAWMTAYDVEPLHTLETKRKLQKWALETNAILIFPHDPFRPMGRLQLSENSTPMIDPIADPYVNA
jgi:glyoxylase-like metal-dependent hydrolase (beta-lactamase superfamily II)